MKSPIQRQLEIFSAALERSAGPERDAFLTQACAGDARVQILVGDGHFHAIIYPDCRPIVERGELPWLAGRDRASG